jgi:hypothetical protein
MLLAITCRQTLPQRGLFGALVFGLMSIRRNATMLYYTLLPHIAHVCLVTLSFSCARSLAPCGADEMVQKEEPP